jgi:hypothetical protein
MGVSLPEKLWSLLQEEKPNRKARKSAIIGFSAPKHRDKETRSALFKSKSEFCLTL